MFAETVGPLRSRHRAHEPKPIRLPLLAHLLYGVSARDPFALLTGPLVLGIVPLLAIWLPAHRAMAMDPMAALRLE